MAIVASVIGEISILIAVAHGVLVNEKHRWKGTRKEIKKNHIIKIPPPYLTMIQTNHGARIQEKMSVIFFFGFKLIFFAFFPGFFFGPPVDGFSELRY